MPQLPAPSPAQQRLNRNKPVQPQQPQDGLSNWEALGNPVQAQEMPLLQQGSAAILDQLLAPQSQPEPKRGGFRTSIQHPDPDPERLMGEAQRWKQAGLDLLDEIDQQGGNRGFVAGIGTILGKEWQRQMGGLEDLLPVQYDPERSSKYLPHIAPNAEIYFQSAFNLIPMEGVVEAVGMRPRTMTEWSGFYDAIWTNVQNGSYGEAALQALDAGLDIAPWIAVLVAGMASSSATVPVAMAAATLGNIVDRVQQVRKGTKGKPFRLGDFSSDQVKNILRHTLQKGGVTIDPKTGRMLGVVSPKVDAGLFVAEPGGAVLPAGEISYEAIMKFIKQHERELGHKNTYFGLWLDDSGALYIDTVKRLDPDKMKQAQIMGRQGDQKELFDMRAQQPIKIADIQAWLRSQEFQERVWSSHETGMKTYHDLQLFGEKFYNMWGRYVPKMRKRGPLTIPIGSNKPALAAVAGAQEVDIFVNPRTSDEVLNWMNKVRKKHGLSPDQMTDENFRYLIDKDGNTYFIDGWMGIHEHVLNHYGLPGWLDKQAGATQRNWLPDTDGLTVGGKPTIDAIISKGASMRDAKVNALRSWVYKTFPSEHQRNQIAAAMASTSNNRAVDVNERDMSELMRRIFAGEELVQYGAPIHREILQYDPKTMGVRYVQLENWTKVADPETGLPMMVVHATNKNLEGGVWNPDKGQIGIHFGPPEQASDIVHIDRFKTMSRAERVASSNFNYDARMHSVYLDLQNPLRMRDLGAWRANTVLPELRRMGLIDPDHILMRKYNDPLRLGNPSEREIREYIESLGYDGIVYLNRAEGLDLQKGYATIASDTDAEFLKVHPEADDSYIVFHDYNIHPATETGLNWLKVLAKGPSAAAKGKTRRTIMGAQDKANMLKVINGDVENMGSVTAFKQKDYGRAVRQDPKFADDMAIALDRWWHRLASNPEKNIFMQGPDRFTDADEVAMVHRAIYEAALADPRHAIKSDEELGEYAAKAWVGMLRTMEEKGELFGQVVDRRNVERSYKPLLQTFDQLFVEKAEWLSQRMPFTVSPEWLKKMWAAGDANVMAITIAGSPLMYAAWMTWQAEEERQKRSVVFQPTSL